MSPKVLKLAIIGGGINSAVGNAHRIACQMDRRWNPVCGAFSSNPEINIESAKSWSVESSGTYKDWKDLIHSEASNIDAALVLTPTPSHFEIVKSALSNRIPVICEKALTRTAAEAKELSETVKTRQGFLCAVFNYTGYTMIRELREIVTGGQLGHVFQINIQMPQEGFIRFNKEGSPPQPQEWRLKDESLPTISLDLGTHVFHLIRFITGGATPVELVATTGSHGHFADVIDNVLGIIKYSNDITCQVWFSKSALGHSNGLKIEIYGDKGAASWSHSDPEDIRLFDAHGNRKILNLSSVDCKIASDKKYHRFKAGHPTGFIEAFANHYSDLADALLSFKNGQTSKNDFVFGCSDAIEGLLILEAIQKSVSTRSWQKVEA